MSVTSVQTIKDFSPGRRFVRGLASKNLAPLILLECFVTGGRSIQAYKRDGYIEARERFTEDSVGAVFWFAGVKSFNAINDQIGKKVLKLKNINFDVGKDSVRNPVQNFLKDSGKHLSEKQLGVFKFAKVAASIVLANALVGFVVPKINQSITAKRLKNGHDKEIQAPRIGMEQFLNKKGLSFQGNSALLLSLAHQFENNSKYQLLSTDVGIAGGRGISARNSHERTEILFRDLTSIYFYMFNMPNINGWLNQISDGRKTRLDPVAAKQVSAQLEKMLNNSKMSIEEFKTAALGNEHNIYKITPELSAKFKNDVITLKEFSEHVKHPGLSDLAQRMSKLQPEINGNAVLTGKQAKDIFKGGALNNPEFIGNIYNVATKGNYINKDKFVSYGELTKIHEDTEHFVQSIIKKAQKSGGEVTAEIVRKAARENFFKNSLHWGIGFAVSALFLSTLIPKIQYWITRVTTGKDRFPGITDY
ncbi:MAG: hypothetical protein LBK53_09740 [Heliobacteriaceae bacterium]|jgi:hypothetical protein|nr:hypothetical protein [Heliobacteriaceae bacterium]